jgi:hypothetical protein
MTLEEKEYVYCEDCKRIRYPDEVGETSHGLKCLRCGGSRLREAVWVECPHRKTVVKCAMGGRGLGLSRAGYECLDRCRALTDLAE